MSLIIISIPPEAFDADLHILPTAGELLLAGDSVTINAEGIVFNSVGTDVAHGLAIEACRKGDVVEIASTGIQQEDGGFYFEHICVIQQS